MVTTKDDVAELYVPGPVDVALAGRRYGVAPPGIGEAAIAVAPVSGLFELSVDPALQLDPDGWAVAHPVSVALDLAQDRARGRQILEDWDWPGRVWA